MPRNGLGMPISASQSQAAPVVIDDVLWEDFGGSGGEIAVNYQETRTNIVLHSQDTTDAEAWTKENTAIDSTLYEAPDNSTTANAIKSDGTGEQVYNIKQDGLSVTAGKTYTLSAHVKKENLGFAQLRFSDGDGLPKAHFNLTTGAITHASNTIRTQIDAMDNDWYRCSITFVATTSTGSGMVFAQSAAGDGTPNVAVSGIVLIYVWGFQLEENIEASPYIVTTTEARTATTSLNDTSDVWDFDSANLMPEADPDSEGVWEIPANLVLNGDYEELGSELVTNGDFSQIGSEEVTNGDFATDSDWSKGTGITISGGKANFANTAKGQRLQQNFSFTAGKTYKIVIVVSNYSSGNLGFYMGGDYAIQNINANGTYTLFHTPTNNTEAFFRAMLISTLHTFSVDSVTVKEVAQDWTLGGADWNIGDSKLVGVNATTETSQQILPTTTTRNLKISFDVVVDSGSIAVYMTDQDKNWITSSTSIIKYVTSDSRTLEIDGRNSDPFSGSVTNISVQEVDPNDRWTLGTGWSIEDGKAKGAAGTQSNLTTANNPLTVGDTVEITYTISDYVAGSAKAFFGGGLAGTVRTSNGTFTEINVVTTNGSFLIQKSADGNLSIDNVTVKEYAIQPQDV